MTVEARDRCYYFLGVVERISPEISDEMLESLVSKNKGAFEASLKRVEEFVHSYFRQVAEWEQKDLDLKEIRRDLKFFAAVDRVPPSKWEFAKQILSIGWIWATSGCYRLDIKNIVMRALWFRNHPYHERCLRLLKQFYFPRADDRDPVGPGNTLYHLIEIQKVPAFVLDRLYLGNRTETLHPNKSKEENFASLETNLREIYRIVSEPKDVWEERFVGHIQLVIARRDNARAMKSIG